MDGDKTMLGMKVGTFLEVAMIDPEKIKSPSPNHIQIGVGLDKQLITLNSEGKKQQVSGSSFIFITDVVKVNPENNIGEKKYLQGTSPINEVLTQCESDGLDVKVFFLTKGGMVHTPTVKIGESECGNLTGSWSTYFTGSITTELNSEIVSPDFQDVIVKNDSGQQATVQVCYNAPPIVTSIALPAVEGYPGNQTELKAGDVVNITVDGNRPFKKVHVIGGSDNAAQAYTHTLSDPANTATFPITIADNGVSSVDRNVTVQIETESESRSVDYTSPDTLKCCNQSPVISVASIEYPTNQEALDYEQKAIIHSSINEYSTAQFALIENDLTILNNDYGGAKEVTCNSNLYNVSNANVCIGATRVENDFYKELPITVKIASSNAAMISTNAFSVRSGVGAQSIPTYFDQHVKVISAEVTEGQLGDGVTTGYVKNYSPTILAADSDTHSDNILYINMEIENLAGKTNIVQRPFKIKGFAQRSLTFTPPEDSKDIGCVVVNTNNLIISGQINTTPSAFEEVLKTRVDESFLRNSASNVLSKHYALNSTRDKLLIHATVCANFGYASPITLTAWIEEI